MGFSGKSTQSWEDYAEELEKKLADKDSLPAENSKKDENTDGKKGKEQKEVN